MPHKLIQHAWARILIILNSSSHGGGPCKESGNEYSRYDVGDNGQRIEFDFIVGLILIGDLHVPMFFPEDII